MARALVAVLAGETGRPAGSPVSVETITDELWGDVPPRNAKAALQTLVSRLRAVAADGLVVSTARGYALAVSDEQTDSGQARLLGRQATLVATADPAAAVAHLDRALALWRGEPGTDLPDSPVRDALIEDAASTRDGLLDLRARCLVDAGEPERALRELEKLAKAHPFDESLHLTHLRALAAAGRRQEAIAAFAAFRTLLREEFGSSPSPELVAVNTQLLQDDSAPSPGRDTRVRIGLRAAPNELLGREHDIEAVQRLLDRARLVTVLGAGGLGKTRLAQELGARSASPGVVFVELASVRTDADVTLALASTLGIRELSPGQKLVDAAPRPDVRERIIAQLGERPTLLIVDNCEQVVDGAALWVAELLASLPRLRVLATSRSPLLIGAEQVYALESLPARDASGEPGPAVRLFTERARAARPSVALPPDAVARLCTRLDGLPLAIELAAARVRSMSVEQIESRLENRFALLTSGDRSAPERHRTLQAVIEWSWTLLRPQEQRALRRLSLFVDGFGLEAAVQVTGEDAADLLDALVIQSLLAVSDDAVTGQPRYRMLETVREFGQVALADADDTASARDAVFSWAEAFSTRAMGDAMGARQVAMFHHVAVEQDNLVAVLREAIALRDGRVVLSVFALLGYYWSVRGAHTEVFSFTTAVLDATAGHRPDAKHANAAAFAYIMLTGTNFVIGNREGFRARSRLRAVTTSGADLQPWLTATAGFLLAFPDMHRASDLLAGMAASHDVPSALIGSIISAQIAENDGDPEAARIAARRAYELSQTSGDVWIGSMAAMSLAQLASQSAHAEEVLVWVDRARAGMEQLEVVQDLQQINWILGGSLLALGRLDDARTLFDDMVTNELTIDDGLEMVSVGEFGHAELARIEGRSADAAERYLRAIASFATPASRASPWFYMTLSARVSSAVIDGDQDAADIARWAARLRARILALHRARPDYVDKPVLAASVLGWSAWAMTQPGLAGRGLELFALAEALHARQDLPALQLAPHLEAARRRFGDGAVRAAQDAAAGLTLDGRAARAYELMALPVPAA